MGNVLDLMHLLISDAKFLNTGGCPFPLPSLTTLLNSSVSMTLHKRKADEIKYDTFLDPAFVQWAPTDQPNLKS